MYISYFNAFSMIFGKYFDMNLMRIYFFVTKSRIIHTYYMVATIFSRCDINCAGETEQHSFISVAFLLLCCLSVCGYGLEMAVRKC